MEIKLKKPMEKLEKEIRFKSVDLDEDIKDFSVDIHNYKTENKHITISPRCIRCNLCAEECPVNAIQSATWFRKAKIEDNCVQCEICAQTCPISCIYVLEAESTIEKDEVDEEGVKYFLKDIPVRHRLLKMKDISVTRNICVGCGSCTRFCPTKAISLKPESFIKSHGEKIASDYEVGIDTIDFNTDSNGERLYSYIEKDLCIGCGSCKNLCMHGAIELERDLGPVIIYSHIDVNQDKCVGCFLCEENCPVNAIRIVEGRVVLDDDKCIRCKDCTTRCPVNALNLVIDEEGLDL
ncbi:MAG: 4Fe-4S binding protein [archaeon]|nr:4Fe-4S binding protein [archaeon]